METLTKIFDNDRDQIIEATWNNTKDRLIDDAGSQALYVSLDSPRPNFTALTHLMLEAMQSEQAESWARRFGRLVISIRAQSGLSCQLADVNDKKSKLYIPVNTQARLDPAELIPDFPEGSLGTILLNDKPTTVEAILISYLHMVEELVWDRYRVNLAEKNQSANSQLYQETVGEVIAGGFSVQTMSEEQILKTKRLRPSTSIRLYGSGVNKDVSKIMGAIVYPDQEHSVPPAIIAAVTMGKELHLGHLLLLASADLLRVNLNRSEPLTLINNNTGPRAAGALVSLSDRLGLSLDETAAQLDQAQIPIDQIIASYRSRQEESVLTKSAMELLDQGPYNIFAAMAVQTRQDLSQIGFDVEITSESETLPNARPLIDSLNPAWAGSGFNFLDARGVKVLEKNGSLTATAKAVVALVTISRSQTSLEGQQPKLIFVDGSGDTTDAISIVNTLPGLEDAIQTSGASIGFDGRIASGSKGEALTMTELINQAMTLDLKRPLASVLRRLVLTRPMMVPFITSPNLLEGFFDFANNQSFLDTLIACQQELIDFEKSHLTELGETSKKIGFKTTVSTPKAAKALEYIGPKSQAIVRIKDEDIIKHSTRMRVLRAPEIEAAVKDQGYVDEAVRRRVNQYLEGPEGLVIRENYFLQSLRTLSNLQTDAETLSEKDFQSLNQAVLFCLKRLGFT